MKIFIVEDNPLYAAVLEQNLQSCGFNDVKSFDDGEKCLASIDLKPEVILLDYQLGENKFNGIDIIKELKKRAAKTKVLLLSSQDEVHVAVESLQLGAFDYIIKGKYAMDSILNSLHKIRRMQKVDAGTAQASKLKQIFYAGVVGFGLLILLTYGFDPK
jgi:DNA-binding response OmpR family regulator